MRLAGGNGGVGEGEANNQDSPFSRSQEFLQVSSELGERALDEQSHDQSAPEGYPGHANVAHEKVQLRKVELSSQATFGER